MRAGGDGPVRGGEVAGEALPPFITYSKETTGSEVALFEGGLEHLLRRPDRFDWEDMCELYARLDRTLAPGETLEALLAERALDMPVFGAMMRLLGLVTRPALLYTFGNRFGLHRIFSHIDVHDEVLTDGRVAVEVRIPRSHRDSQEFLRATAGILTALPRLIGLPDSLVVATYGPRRARYLITPPRSQTLVSRARRGLSAFFLGREALREMSEQQAQLNVQYNELQRAYAETKEALQVRRRFLSIISHELRTPLNGIVGAASTLETETDPRIRAELGESLHLSIGDMSRLVESILEFTRLDQGHARPTFAPFSPRADLAELLSRARLQAEAKGLRLDVQLGPELPTCVSIDGPRVQQVLRELVDNAVKFTVAGAVSVKLEYDSPGHLQIEVEDTGPGIAPADQERVFELFTQLDDSSTRRHRGVGLGLTLVQRLVAILRGTVDLDSEIGRGTRVRARIPCEVASGPPAAEVRGDARLRRALVVDDNRINRRVLARMLTRAGYAVDEAEDGRAAVHRTEQRAYSAVFMDVEMPVMDGCEATSAIRARDRSTPIIATTAYVTDDDRARCFAVGMSDFLGKPVTPAQVTQALLRWVGPLPPGGS